MTELPAGLLSMLFMGISLAFLPVFFTIIKASKDSSSYNLMVALGIICLVIDFILILLEIFIPFRLFINYQRFRSERINSINAICITSIVIIVIMMILGSIFMM